MDPNEITPVVVDIGVKQFTVNPLIFRYGFLNHINPTTSLDEPPTYRVQFPTIELSSVLNLERNPIDMVQLFERLLRLMQAILDLTNKRNKILEKADNAFYRDFELNLITDEIRSMSISDLAAFAVLASLVRAERIKRECDKVLTTRCRRNQILGYELFVFAKRHRLVELCRASINQLVDQYGHEAESRFGISMEDMKLAFTPTFSYDPVLALYHMARVDAELDVPAEVLFRKVHDQNYFVVIKSVERMRHLREWMLEASFITGGVLKFALELVRHLRISSELDPTEKAQAEYTLKLLKMKINDYRYRKRYA